MAVPARRSPLSRLAAVTTDLSHEAPPVRPTATPARRAVTPRRPDSRLIAGLLLIVLSGAIGARTLAAGQDSVRAWVFTRDLPAGAVIVDGDITSTNVSALTDSYARADVAVIGNRLSRPVTAGEFVPVAGMSKQMPAADSRLVTVAVDPLHAPANLQRGHKVDVWSTARVESVVSAPALVLPKVLVADVPAVDQRGITASVGVTLDVPVDQVPQLIAALRAGDVDLVRVP